jgi:hypothetical protein
MIISFFVSRSASAEIRQNNGDPVCGKGIATFGRSGGPERAKQGQKIAAQVLPDLQGQRPCAAKKHFD